MILVNATQLQIYKIIFFFENKINNFVLWEFIERPHHLISY